MANYLITGGAGFIGSHLAETLLKAGHRVRILDNFSTGRRENIKVIQMIAPQNLEIIEGDIRNRKACDQAVSGMDFVFHEAAQVSVPKSVNDPETTQEINIGGTLNILSAGKRAGIKRLVLASSTAIYGDSPNEKDSLKPKKEPLTPNPLSPYALSKLVGEYYCRLFSKVYDLPAVALRYFNVFGPRQDPNSEYAAVIPKFIERLLQDTPPVIYGDGKQSRDFVYVGDVVQANLKACLQTGIEGEVFNIASGRSYTLLQLLEHLKKILRSDQGPVFEPARLGDIRHSKADIRKARKLLGFQPETGFRQGLKTTIKMMKKTKGVR
ncbi:MAG: Vi polysaccharide biosynthesis protein VipB/TviC [Deltaproteobacteria bacterium RBG_13_43_22]|nr:MAG: Vi polysaccharide biosynthesis protein VipB/TviC [Deltaproteobacteria bacterium RBG_13_43_22]